MEIAIPHVQFILMDINFEKMQKSVTYLHILENVFSISRLISNTRVSLLHSLTRIKNNASVMK